MKCLFNSPRRGSSPDYEEVDYRNEGVGCFWGKLYRRDSES